MPGRIFSGVQPTGNIHIGTYLGALRNWVRLQKEYESFFCVVDLHAITIPQDPAHLRRKTSEVARLYLATGIDPALSTVFVQSSVLHHAELAWILNCITRVSELDRMTQFKEKGRKQRENTSAGLFNYPVLMAADILLYQTDLVPVGEDQKQHLELTRNIAERFNKQFGETFRVPEPYITKVGARIMSLDDPAKKMSKSDERQNGSIFLLDSPDAIRKKVKRAVTDSGTAICFDPDKPALKNLLTIYQMLTGKSESEIETHFQNKGYAQLKGELADELVRALEPVQQRFHDISENAVSDVLEKGRSRAAAIAETTMSRVIERVGLSRNGLEKVFPHFG